MMKTVAVSIEEEQAEKLHEFAEMRQCTISQIARDALILWFDVEGPVYAAALKGLPEKLKRAKRSRIEHLEAAS